MRCPKCNTENKPYWVDWSFSGRRHFKCKNKKCRHHYTEEPDAAPPEKKKES